MKRVVAYLSALLINKQDIFLLFKKVSGNYVSRDPFFFCYTFFKSIGKRSFPFMVHFLVVYLGHASGRLLFFFFSSLGLSVCGHAQDGRASAFVFGLEKVYF